ncbi:hypothetical protein LTR27_001151 [Elasticomyces elasticus]|nr:hypothetical protein LTR27_001151 [Elasticomyces elasticus]
MATNNIDKEESASASVALDTAEITGNIISTGTASRLTADSSLSVDEQRLQQFFRYWNEAYAEQMETREWDKENHNKVHGGEQDWPASLSTLPQICHQIRVDCKSYVENPIQIEMYSPGMDDPWRTVNSFKEVQELSKELCVTNSTEHSTIEEAKLRLIDYRQYIRGRYPIGLVKFLHVPGSNFRMLERKTGLPIPHGQDWVSKAFEQGDGWKLYVRHEVKRLSFR